MKWLLLLCLSSLLSCQALPEAERHLFYLHPRIVELQGPAAVSPQFGPYYFEEIVAALAAEGFTVYADLRTAEVDFYAYCNRVSAQIDSLIAQGVTPADIAVVGASKGAVMAMQIAHQTPHPVNYVLLAANTTYLEEENDWNLHGRILGIYERTDSLAGRNYAYWIARSTHAQAFEQLELDTGLSHGFIYQPLREWIEPMRIWLAGKTPSQE